tara:strand:+ start:293 stop:520 length:228 start_codon:yes stop_codon:yes gene_type:complete
MRLITLDRRNRRFQRELRFKLGSALVVRMAQRPTLGTRRTKYIIRTRVMTMLAGFLDGVSPMLVAPTVQGEGWHQ